MFQLLVEENTTLVNCVQSWQGIPAEMSGGETSVGGMVRVGEDVRR